VRASFSLPLVVLYRAGHDQRSAMTATLTLVCILENGAKFISKERAGLGVLAATCYFATHEFRGYPRGSWYRVVAMKTVYTHRRADETDLSRPPENAQPVVNLKWDERDRFRHAISFVTEATWGFDRSGKPRPISRFAQFPAARPMRSQILLRPRPQYRAREGRR
jgi:hypothetical protein